MNTTPSERSDITAWLKLTLVPGISARTQLALLDRYKTPHQVLSAPPAEIAASFGEATATLLSKGPAPAAVDATLRWLEEPTHRLVTLADGNYPARLLEIAVPPCVIYVRGRVELLRESSIAVVGSRNASAQGLRDAEAFARELSAAGLTIVSGLALGIDAAAHRGGLQADGASIAVMGTGADRIYPRRNQALGDELARDGLLLSEFPLGSSPAPGNFPRRNRLISGLARGVLVVEAALNSGSLITAKYALEQGREVFALPGSIHSPLSKGCHDLIKQGAKLVENVDDILAELGWGARAAPVAPALPAADASHPLLDAMGDAPVSLDQISQRTGRAAGWIAAALSRLELQGAVAALAGGFFQRLHKP